MMRLMLAAVLLVSSCTTQGLDPTAPPTIDAQLSETEGMKAYRQMWFSMSASTDPNLNNGGRNVQVASFVGREDVIVAERGADLGLKTCDAIPGDAMGEIVRRAAGTNIVIINEAHESPRDRHFIAAVARALRPLGYSIYAAETFNTRDPLNHPFVSMDDGYYSTEPIFARLVGEAKSLGYRLVGYEMADFSGLNALPYAERVTRREIAQTENLMAAIFRDDPEAKVLIHVGFQHVQERAQPGKVEWMAQRLAAATGRDPLTISQTDCLSGTGVTTLALGPDDHVDLFVAHPPLLLKDGRPAWRQKMGEIPTRVPDAMRPKTEAVVIEARPDDTPVDIVPMDRLLLRPGETLPLLLPPGRYRLDQITPRGFGGSVRVEVE